MSYDLYYSIDQIGQVHDDIWIYVFKYFTQYPALFNLYNINSQFTRVIDNHFHKVTIDFDKCFQLNTKRDIAQQVYYMVDYCHRTTTGMIMNTYGKMDRMWYMESAVQTILNANACELKLFHFVGRYSAEQDPLFRNLFSRAINLRSVIINIGVRSSTSTSNDNAVTVDLSTLAYLRSLKVSADQGEGSVTVILPMVPLDSLTLIGCDVFSISELQNVLSMSRDTLVELNMTDLKFDLEPIDAKAMTSFVFPNIKWLSIVERDVTASAVEPVFEIKLEESLLLESISVCQEENKHFFKVVGFDFRTHSLLKAVTSQADSINFESFFMPDAYLEGLESLDFIDLEDPQRIVQRLEYGCDQLESVRFKNTVIDEFVSVEGFIRSAITNGKLRILQLPYFKRIPIQNVVNAIMNCVAESNNQTLEYVQCLPNDLLDWTCNRVFDPTVIVKLGKSGYRRSNVLKIKVPGRNLFSRSNCITFLNEFNIEFEFHY